MALRLSAEASLDVAEGGGALIQNLDRYLRGEATRVIEREGYVQVNGFLTRQMRVARDFAIRGTNRKYPKAFERDPRRHPDPDLPHLADSWVFTPATSPAGATLANLHPKASMLLLGFSTPSEISPENSSKTNRNGEPVLIFPKRPNPSHLWARNSGVVKLTKTVVRPVPESQRPVDPRESIGYVAIRQAFRNARRRG